MENASKAIIMAGSILIAMIIISLLVLFFTNLRNLQRTETQVDEIEQAAEFNKQYDVYARDIYGSEIFSLANKVQDYNKKEAENEGYEKIELYVTFTATPDDNYFKKKKTYTASEIYSIVNSIEKDMEDVGKHTYSSDLLSGVTRRISNLATMRTKEKEDLGFGSTNIKSSDIEKDISNYNYLKTLVSTIKQRTFKYDKFEYDKQNGRIVKMYYTYK